MIDLIRDNLEKIHELCRQHHVRKLEVFGSAADGRYREGESDLDFIVEFETLEPGGLGRAFFDLLRALEALFGVHVDLLALKPEYDINPYFRQEIERTRQVIHEDTRQGVPA
jgi:uncharacterized protein